MPANRGQQQVPRGGPAQGMPPQGGMPMGYGTGQFSGQSMPAVQRPSTLLEEIVGRTGAVGARLSMELQRIRDHSDSVFGIQPAAPSGDRLNGGVGPATSEQIRSNLALIESMVDALNAEITRALQV